jgi:2-polyprenyl-6-methoxyphenol hydroxylase-like FAD-dependent oxidoreductase
MSTALVSGAGIAGLSAAYWLRHTGYEVTVVEKAAGNRLGGQPIDVRGPALEVAEKIGILSEVRQARTQMMGMSIIDAEGLKVEDKTDWTVSTGPLDLGDVELLRDDLVRLLFSKLPDVKFVYGDSITGINEAGEHVDVTFANAPERQFDLIVGADGLYSNVRDLIFGDAQPFMHHLGTYLSVCTSANFLGLENWQLWHTGESAGFIVFPVRNNSELRITLTFQSPAIEYSRDVQEQKQLVASRLSHLKGCGPQLLEAMLRSTDFYFVPMAQIRMPRWSKGRVVLLGDAGYCASPLSGQGTSVAMVGAYVLGEELRKAGDDFRMAFGRYEQRMRPFVSLNQAIATAAPAEALDTFMRARAAISLDASTA